MSSPDTKGSISFRRVTSTGSLPSENPVKPLQNPGEPRRALEGTPVAEASENPSERQISSEGLAEGCLPSDGDPVGGVNTGRFGKIVFSPSFERFFDPLSK